MENFIRKKETRGRKSQHSYLLEVVASNQHKGRHILLHNHHDARTLGLRPNALLTTVNLPNPVLSGLHVQRVPTTTGEIPGQQEIIDYFISRPNVFNLRHNPVIGKIQTGPFAGEHIALFSVKEIQYYFSLDYVRASSQFQKQYAGITWWEARSIAEAEMCYYHPEQWVLLSVFRKRYRYPYEEMTQAEKNTHGDTILDIANGLRQWYSDYSNLETLTREQYFALAEWCQKLDKSIRCHDHYIKVRDTLRMLKAMLVEGKPLRSQLFMGHCKILERLANEFRYW